MNDPPRVLVQRRRRQSSHPSDRSCSKQVPYKYTNARLGKIPNSPREINGLPTDDQVLYQVDQKTHRRQNMDKLQGIFLSKQRKNFQLKDQQQRTVLRHTLRSSSRSSRTLPTKSTQPKAK